MALKKRLIRAYAAVRNYRARIRRLDDDESPNPPAQAPFTFEFTYEFEGRPNTQSLEFSEEFSSEFA